MSYYTTISHKYSFMRVYFTVFETLVKHTHTQTTILFPFALFEMSSPIRSRTVKYTDNTKYEYNAACNAE